MSKFRESSSQVGAWSESNAAGINLGIVTLPFINDVNTRGVCDIVRCTVSYMWLLRGAVVTSLRVGDDASSVVVVVVAVVVVVMVVGVIAVAMGIATLRGVVCKLGYPPPLVVQPVSVDVP